MQQLTKINKLIQGTTIDNWYILIDKNKIYFILSEKTKDRIKIEINLLVQYDDDDYDDDDDDDDVELKEPLHQLRIKEPLHQLRIKEMYMIPSIRGQHLDAIRFEEINTYSSNGVIIEKHLLNIITDRTNIPIIIENEYLEEKRESMKGLMLNVDIRYDSYYENR